MGRSWRLIQKDLSNGMHYEKLPVESLSRGMCPAGVGSLTPSRNKPLRRAASAR